MQIEQIISRADGNGKTVTVSVNHNSHTDRKTYYGAVMYEDSFKMGFDQKFNARSDAIRWFKTWSRLTA